MREFRISRATLFPEAELKALLADLVGRDLSFSELQQAAMRIAEHYRNKGYLARAYLPPQTIDDGVVEIVVVEGKLGGVDVDIPAKARLDSELARSILLRQQKLGEPLRLEDVERGVHLINDLPGVSAQALMVPGKKEGETAILLKAEDGPPVTGLASLDNQGIRSTGLWRAIGSLAVNNPSGQGDQVTLLGLAGERQYYVRGAYTSRVGLDGLRVGINASQLEYRLDRSFVAVSGDGQATTAGVTLSYPLLRTTAANLYSGVNYDEKRLVNNYLGVNANTRRIGVWNLLLSGDRLDTYFGGGLMQFNTTLSFGSLRMKNPGEVALDDAGPHARGHFARLTWGASRLQRLGDSTGLFVNLTGQFATHNLDFSEKFSLGGPNGVRAYPVNEGNGDEGWMLNVELRHSVRDEFQILGFVDAGEIRINKSPWPGWDTASPNRPKRYGLHGAGVGVSYGRSGDYLIRATLAAPIGSNPGKDANGNDSDGRRSAARAWVQVVKYF